MKILKAELQLLKLPIKTPFTVSFGTMTERHLILVKLFTEDLVGYGECSAFQDPSYVPEFTGSEWLILKDFLLPHIVGKEISHPQELAQLFQPIKGHQFAKASVECAVWHLLAQKENKSLQELFGGTQEQIEVGESIGLQSSIESTVEVVEKAVKKGYRRIKLKIKKGWDRQITKAVREAFPNIPLMLDGNSDYRLEDTELFEELDQYDLMMIEQPLSYDDIVDHSILQQKITTPISLDESIRTRDDARRAIHLKSCGNINIKPGRVGGPLETIAIHDLMQRSQLPVWCGGLLETGIGRAFNIALASLPNFSLPADMSEPTEFYQDDLVKNPYTIDDGLISVPTQPGLGFDIDETMIQKYRSDSLSISS